jgi:hypothetical protein
MTFADLLYMLSSALPIPPLDMLGSLAMPTRRSPELRLQFFFILCYVPLPLNMLRGLALPI